MGKYRLKKPVVFLKGNKVVAYTHPAELVTLDDDVAAKLGDKVERLGQSETKKVVVEKQ